MPQFLILPLETRETFAKFGRSEMRAIVKRYGQWTRGLAQRRWLVNGDRIVEGLFLEKSGGKMDASEADQKQLTPGGFWLIRARSMKEALKICEDCPHFDFGPLQVLRIEGNRRA